MLSNIYSMDSYGNGRAHGQEIQRKSLEAAHVKQSIPSDANVDESAKVCDIADLPWKKKMEIWTMCEWLINKI